ncbi:hypothetical protein C7U89_05075 [Bradyrhizobium sp. WBOS4]|nr:hypothetical protein [Bradyrhizobium sp. WBOS4]
MCSLPDAWEKIVWLAIALQMFIESRPVISGARGARTRNPDIVFSVIASDFSAVTRRAKAELKPSNRKSFSP